MSKVERIRILPEKSMEELLRKIKGRKNINNADLKQHTLAAVITSNNSENLKQTFQTHFQKNILNTRNILTNKFKKKKGENITSLTKSNQEISWKNKDKTKGSSVFEKFQNKFYENFKSDNLRLKLKSQPTLILNNKREDEPNDYSLNLKSCKSAKCLEKASEKLETEQLDLDDSFSVSYHDCYTDWDDSESDISEHIYESVCESNEPQKDKTSESSSLKSNLTKLYKSFTSKMRIVKLSFSKKV